MAWKVFSISTDTWGDAIELPGDPSGSRALNTGSSSTMTFQTRDASVNEVVTDKTIGHLTRALVMEEDNIPVYVGIILSSEEDVDAGTITVTHTDIWWLFKFRHVLAMHGDGAQTLPPLVFSGSLADIAKQAIAEGNDAAPLARYRLPIVWPANEGGTQSRMYHGYKFLSVQDALDELMKTDGGPDIDFTLRWNNLGQIEFVFRAGALTQGLWEWDATAPQSEVRGLKLRTDASRVSNKVIGTGEGSERELKVRAEESFADSTYPAIERVVSYSGISDSGHLAARARADLLSSNEPTRQMSFSVPGNGVVRAKDLILGGTARIKTAGLRFHADGWSEWRLIQFDFDRQSVTLQFQQQGG